MEIAFLAFAIPLLGVIEFIVELSQSFDDALHHNQVIEGHIYLRQIKREFGLLEVLEVIIHHELLLKSSSLDRPRRSLMHSLLHQLSLTLNDVHAFKFHIEWINHLTFA